MTAINVRKIVSDEEYREKMNGNARAENKKRPKLSLRENGAGRFMFREGK